MVSFRHATVSLEGAQIRVRDRDSTNGTFIVDGAMSRRVSDATAVSGSTVSFGGIVVPVDALIVQLKAMEKSAVREGPSPDQRYDRCANGHIKPAGSPCAHGCA